MKHHELGVDVTQKYALWICFVEGFMIASGALTPEAPKIHFPSLSRFSGIIVPRERMCYTAIT